MLAQLTDADLSQQGSPYGGLVNVQLNCAGEQIDATLFRISYVGDTGWEISVDWDDAPKLWDALMAAGADHGIRPTGGGVYGTSGRLEKGYRLQGAELESEYNPLEAGLARPKVKSADFIGKAAYLAARERGEPEVHMCTLIVEDQTDSQGRVRWMQGGNEPICDLDGNVIFDSHGRVSRVTSAGYGPSVGKHLLMAYLPTDHAAPGTAPAGDVHERAVPRDGRGHRQRVRSRRHPAQGLAMRVLVCVKRVPAPGAKINITADGQRVDTTNLGFTMSPHEECGGRSRRPARRGPRRRGDGADPRDRPKPRSRSDTPSASACSTAVVMPISGDEWDPQRTAQAITSAVRDLEATDGPFDLVLFGNESADAGGFQVGIRVAYVARTADGQRCQGAVRRRRDRPRRTGG